MKRLSLPIVFCLIMTLMVSCTVALSSCTGDTSTSPTINHPVVGGTEYRPTATPTLPSLSSYETGIVAPAWSSDAYSHYGTTLHQMKEATDARWVELPILLQQAQTASNAVTVSPNQVTPDSLAIGIQNAHAEGLRVFVIPLLTVTIPDGWAGIVHPSDPGLWFHSYWQTFQPYVEVAQRYHADQLSIGTEMNWLQSSVDPSLWTHLIEQVYSVYTGRMTYDSNWSEIYTDAPTWMHSPHLYAIGVSEYISLSDTPDLVDPTLLPALFRTRVQAQLDAFATNLGKPLIISEMGYRGTSDALYHAYASNSSSPKSPQEQKGAYAAALGDLQGDSHVVGTFLWGWRNTGMFDLDGTQATETIKHYYDVL